jgi:hypothetical protein
MLQSFSVFAQTLPSSFLNDKLIDKVELLEIDNPLDGLNKKPNDLNLFNYTFAVSITRLNLANEGKWVLNDNDEWIWLLRIEAKQAKALGLDFKNIKIDNEDQLFIYNTNKNVYNISNNNLISKENYNSEFFIGDNLLLEFDPISNDTTTFFTDQIILNYAYKNIDDIKGFGFGTSGDCEINANCNTEEDFQPEKRAVVRIRTVKTAGFSTYIGWCTGTIIANTNNDDTPYLITADHCYNYFLNGEYEVASADDLKEWLFYFNYDSPDCTNPISEGVLAESKMLGATYKANSGTAGDADSDFCLLELKNKIPEDYNPFWAGWDSKNKASAAGYSYHHPSGDIKKINIYTKPLISSQFDNDGPSNTHWKVGWDSGVTEGGSSGSSIFNSAGQIVGILTGGATSCSTPNDNDYYGKLSYSWKYKEDQGSQLKHWLDPGNTGLEIMLGYDKDGSKQLKYDDKLAIAPNPVTNGVIDFGNINPNLLKEVFIYNINGQLVFKTVNPNKTYFPLYLPSGIYLARTNYDNEVSVNKIMVVN